MDDVRAELRNAFLQFGPEGRADGREKQGAETADTGDADVSVPGHGGSTVEMVVRQYPNVLPGRGLRLCQRLKKGLHATVKRGIILADVEDFHGVE